MSDDLQQKIRERAYRLWEAEGRVHGHDIEHWLQAEQSVAAERGGNSEGPRRESGSRARKGPLRPRQKSDSAIRAE